jgi:hypothetical protein
MRGLLPEEVDLLLIIQDDESISECDSPNLEPDWPPLVVSSLLERGLIRLVPCEPCQTDHGALTDLGRLALRCVAVQSVEV